jgi:PKD repeat protein
VTAEFSATPTSGPAPLAVTFTNLSTGDWSTVSWNFGDGATSTDSNPSHIYTVPGTYTVSLIVIGSGGSDIETKTDYIQVSSLNVSGSVLYWNENKAVPGTVCTLSGDNTYSDTTDLSGDFSISGILAGNYNLIPSKHDQVNGITAYDAALVLRDVAEIETLSGYPAIAADVNQSGEISSLDASYILQKSVGLIETFPDITSMWLFDPVNYTYSNLLEDQINQNFAGVLLGDPTGNWSIEGGTMGLVQLEPSSILTIVATPPDVDGNVTATIYLDPNGTETYGLDLILQYDSTHAELVNVSKGEIGDNWIFATNYSEDGVIRLGIADTQPLAEKQSIAVVEFHLLDLGRTSEFLPVYGSVNEDAIPIDMLGSTLGEVSYKIFIPVIVR